MFSAGMLRGYGGGNMVELKGIHTYTHSYTQTYIHTYIHTHTFIFKFCYVYGYQLHNT